MINTTTVNVQLVNNTLHKQIFKKPHDETTSRKLQATQIEELQRMGLLLDPQITPAYNFELPPLLGADLGSHFREMAITNNEAYYKGAELALKMSLYEVPKKFALSMGWTYYNKLDNKIHSVTVPEESVLFLDAEVLLINGHEPVIVTCLSETGWYIWLTPLLFGGGNALCNIGHDKLIIGHNISYDRIRLKEEYKLSDTGNRFIDTMALHTTVAGLGTKQRALYLHIKKEKEKGSADHVPPWFDQTSMASLADLCKHHLGLNLDKQQRNIFVNGTLSEVKENLEALIKYCAYDTYITARLYQVLFAKFKRYAPSPVTLGGMLTMGSGILPVNIGEWADWLQTCESTTSYKMEVEINQAINKLATDTIEQYSDWLLETGGDSQQESKHLSPMLNPWLRYLDWKLPKRAKKLKDKPEWYRELHKGDKINLTLRSRVTPYLLQIHWQGYPVTYLNWFESGDNKTYDYIINDQEHTSTLRKEGFTLKGSWGYCVPLIDLDNIANLNYQHGVFLIDHPDHPYPIAQAHNADLDAQYLWVRVPHKDGDTANCGNIFAKDYISSIEKGDISSDFELASTALHTASQCSYWISIRKRVFEQFIQKIKVNGHNWGSIIPAVVVAGTVTRRAVEKLWLTASNTKYNKIGSSIKSKIKAPPGFCIVGADVDSQELWLAACLGDKKFKAHGATPFSQQVLKGTKEDGTDFHTRTKDLIGIERITRDICKVFNYSRIYGSGVAATALLIKQCDKTLTQDKCVEIAKELYSQTKGVKRHGHWVGGSESHTFNAMEEIARESIPASPVLDVKFPDTLQPLHVGDDFLTSRVNCVIQASGVDFLHLLITAIDYLSKQWNLKARYMISIHDELRYLCADEDSYKLALVFQIAHLWVRSYICEKWGFYSVPNSVAWFSKVDIDHCLRKEPNASQRTITNEREEPEGVGVNIQQILDKLGVDYSIQNY
jgi:DNA polymerase gamma 1